MMQNFQNFALRVKIGDKAEVGMKTQILRAAVAAMLLAPQASHATDAIYGVWGRDGHANDKLEFYDCAGKLCAKGAVPKPDGSPPPQVLRNAAQTEANSWSGDLFNPENGKMYKGTITLESPTKMTLKGCLVAFLCQSESWTKISGPPPKPAKAAKPAHESKAGKPKAEPPKVEPPAQPAPAPANAGE